MGYAYLIIAAAVLVNGIMVLNTAYDFLSYLLCGKRAVRKGRHIIEVIVLILPVLYFSFITSTADQYGGIRTHSSEFRSRLVVLSLLSLLAYFYSSYRQERPALKMGIIVNGLLVTGLGVTIVLIRETEPWFTGFVFLPVDILLMLALADNYRKSQLAWDDRRELRKLGGRN